MSVGIYASSRMNKHGIIARLEKLAKKQSLSSSRMDARLKCRAEARQQHGKAQRDPTLLSIRQKLLRLEMRWTTERIR